MAMEQSEAVGKFLARIKQTYSKRRLNREKQWPPCKSAKLVRLELVEGEKRQGYSAGQTRGRDDKAIKRRPLAYSDILKGKGSTGTLKVLVEGDAGIGKTTLCTALSEDWANEKLFQEFEILLLLHLRQKRIASAGSLLGLLKLLHSSSEICELVAKHIENQNEGKILIIADGWDELSTKDRSEGSFFYELLFGECYSLSVIVTSRPSASAPLRDLPCIDRLVEVHGFSKVNIKEFIQCEFASDSAKGTGLFQQLEGNPLIESVCSVPLNCAIVCHLWHQFEGALPTTMSELYTKIILNVLLHNIQKRLEYERVRSLSHFSALPDSLQQPWSLLCELAFQTLSEDKIVFSREDLSRKFQNLTSDSKLLCFGLLQSAESILVDGHGVSFHFLHLTFQEYLAALYLVRQPTNKQLQLCQSYAKSQRFKMVWRFFFGINFAICKQAINPGISRVLLDAYSYIYLAPGYNTLSLCHFALEASQRSVDALVASQIKNCRCNFQFYALTAFDFSAAVHVLAKLQDCSYITIDLSNCGLDDKKVAALAEALAGEHRKLKVSHINLSNNKLSDQSVADLFDRASPAFSQSLQEISLWNNMIGPKAIKSITTVLAESRIVATELDDYERSYGEYTKFSLDDNPLGTDGVRVLRDALCANKLVNLEVLSLARSLTDNQDTNAELILALGSGHCRSLRELDLSRNILGEPGGKALGKVLPHLHSEVSLELNETMLGDEGISVFSQNLQDTCKLKRLYLENNDIRLAGISCLAESVCTGKILLSNMPTLGLTNNPLGLEGVIAVVKILSTCSDHFIGTDHVYSIDLSGCQLTTAGGIATNPDFDNAVGLWQFICNRQLKAACRIKELSISNINFSGEGIHVLASFMYACPCVKNLYCRSCGITSDDLKQLLDQISELRPKFSNLDIWDLSDNDIGDDGVSTMIQHLSTFPKLRYIDLDGNIRVSPGMLKTLKEKVDAPRDSTGSDSCVDSSSASELTESEDYGENTLSHMEDSDTEEQCRAKEAEITAVTLTDVGNRPKLNVEVSPPNKRVMPTEGEGVEQMQPTAEETTITEAESVLGNKQEVVHASTSSSLVVGSSSGNELADIEDYREKASPHMADSDTVEQCISGEAGITTVAPKDVGKRRKLINFEVPSPSKRMRTVEDEGVEQLQHTTLDSEERTTTEAESKLGNQQEVVHLSTNSSPIVGSSSNCHTELMDSEDCIEKASPHMADSDMEVGFYSDFKPQSFEGHFTSATSSWKLQNVHKFLTGEGVVIAILDTGIDICHEAFKEKVQQTVIAEINCVNDNMAAFSKPEPHGTMAAFMAAGKGFTARHKQGGGEIKPRPIPSGIAPNAKLIICRVGTPYKAEYIIKALENLIELKLKGEQNSREWGVDVVSMSFGVINDTLTSTRGREDRNKIRDLIEELSRLKVIVVAAAGNYGDNKQTLFPANHQNVFSVGALNKYNRPAAMNPSGDVDVYAPGAEIAAPLVHIPDGVETTHGSSCATPAIAGLVALKIQFERDKCKLLKDVNKDYHVKEILTGENIHFQDVKKMFKDMRTDVDRPNVLDPYNYFKIKCRLNIE